MTEGRATLQRKLCIKAWKLCQAFKGALEQRKVEDGGKFHLEMQLFHNGYKDIRGFKEFVLSDDFKIDDFKILDWQLDEQGKELKRLQGEL